MEKLRIVICDENKQDAEAYATICRSICERCEIPVEMKLYSNSSDLLFDLKDDAFCSLVSILMVEPEGSFAAIPATARKEGYDGLILYLSQSTEHERYLQAFDAEAFNFTRKGTDEKTLTRFQTVFEKAIRAAQTLERQYIVLSCAGEYKQIEVKDIYYFEAAMEHMISVEYRDGSFKFPSTLQGLEERLSGRGFVRTHRSYIVALDAISHLGSDEVTLNNGRRIPISRGYSSSVKAAKNRWQV